MSSAAATTKTNKTTADKLSLMTKSAIPAFIEVPTENLVNHGPSPNNLLTDDLDYHQLLSTMARHKMLF